jgi:hypothetical protein
MVAAEAMNAQVTRDVEPFWGVCATVSYWPDPNSVPQGMWAPRQVLPGGYITWVDPQTYDLTQILWIDPTAPPYLKIPACRRRT